MPNIKSQKDRMRLTEKETARNKANRSTLRTTIKKANASIDANADNMAESVKSAQAALEKAGGKGLIHRNTASRKASRLAKRANKAAAVAQ